MDVPTIQLLDGPVLRMPHRREYPALSGRRYIELRNGIAKHGFVPGMGEVLIDQHDNVIDGHHRLEVAKDLGMFWSAVPWRRIELRDEEHRQEVVRQANLNRRHLTEKEHEERNARIRAKVDAGKSQRQVAREEGVAVGTVNKVVLDVHHSERLEPAPLTDPARTEEPEVQTQAKATNRRQANVERGEEKRRRIAEMLAKGMSQTRIARELGTSPGNVGYHMAKLQEKDKPDASAGERERRRVANVRAAALEQKRAERAKAREVAKALAEELRKGAIRTGRAGWVLPEEKRVDLSRLLHAAKACCDVADEDLARAMLPVSRAVEAVTKAYVG